MKISVWKLISWLPLLLLLALCLWIFNSVEYVEEKITVGFQGSAARNPLLAAGRLSERYGATARYVSAYTKPPLSGTTLVFTAPRDRLTPEQNGALLDWVAKKGGHLLVSPQYQSQDIRHMKRKRNKTDQDPLLDSFGISVKYFPESDSKQQLPATGEPSAEPEQYPRNPDGASEPYSYLLRQIIHPALKPQIIELPDGTRLKAGFDSQWRLEDIDGNSDWRISDPSANARKHKNKGDYGLSYKYGEGRVTVLANLDFINNGAIGNDDHAALFAYLVSLAKGQDIWFVHGTDVPALWRWLVDYAGAVLIAAALLLIAWLWMISRRFGPLLPARSVVRRSIVEHVAASARYLWRCKQGQALYRILCDDFYKRAYLRHPHWSRLSVPELNRQIVLFVHETRIPQFSSLTEHAVGHLLDTSLPRNENQFAADSQLLDILRNKL
ncbi:MAG: DUF4350 domain-containing protein [Betaproteobacteria bacterium]|nr:DUF4350 domain-containing protein [Betaproteobacteria bacterium]